MGLPMPWAGCDGHSSREGRGGLSCLTCVNDSPTGVSIEISKLQERKSGSAPISLLLLSFSTCPSFSARAALSSKIKRGFFGRGKCIYFFRHCFSVYAKEPVMCRGVKSNKNILGKSFASKLRCKGPRDKCDFERFFAPCRALPCAEKSPAGVRVLLPSVPIFYLVNRSSLQWELVL